MHQSARTPAGITLLVAFAILAAAAGLLVAGRADAGATGRTAQQGLASAMAFLAAVIALAGAWALARELKRRRHMEGELRASRAKFEGILSIAVDAIITVDEQQQILHFNHGAERLFGYAESEAIGTPLSRLLPPRYRDSHDRHLNAFASGQVVARRMGERRSIFGLRRDGTEFPAEAAISRLELPGQRFFTVVLRDISERVRAEGNQRFLARAGGVLATTLDYESTLRSVAHVAIPHLADCCVLDLVDPQGFVRTIASVHEEPELTKRLRALERRRADVPSNWPFPVADAIAQERRILRADLAPEWEREGGGHDARVEDVAALGVRAYATIPLVARDRVLGTLTLISTDSSRRYDDVTAALAEELAIPLAFAIENAWLYQSAQQATTARDEILGVVSHDLRNPLSAISMCARVLLESPPDASEERHELAGAILESTYLMQRLIQDLLDVSTIESGHLQVHPRRESLGPLVDAVMQMVRESAEDRGIAIERDFSAALPAVFVDAMRVEQVLANLLGNAVKFTERGGQVRVQAEVHGSFLRVMVCDSGIGIPPEHLPHLFDRYWHARRQSRTAGTGLGLAIARGIVEAHGGTLSVDSTLGVGSTFSLTLPTIDETPRVDGSDGQALPTASAAESRPTAAG